MTGKILKKPYSVTYDAGKLTGDRVAVDIVKVEAQTMHGPVGPVGQYVESNYLAYPLAALVLITGVFTTVDDVTGDVPEAEEPPEGAKA